MSKQLSIKCKKCGRRMKCLTKHPEGRILKTGGRAYTQAQAYIEFKCGKCGEVVFARNPIVPDEPESEPSVQ